MSEMQQLAGWVLEARRNALDLAKRINHADPEAFADKMVEAWLQGRVDQWIIERQYEIYGNRAER